MKIEFYRHNLSKADKKACMDVLNSLFLTTGEAVKIFEEKFAEYLGIKYVVGVTSCTDALFLSLKGLGIQPGDEVITTPMSFIATSTSIEHAGAIPVFVDVEASTGNIDATLIEKAITQKTKAILVVHLYGQMCDMKTISKIAKKHKLKLIEDCAHTIEGERDGIKVGQLADASCYSFYATKNITSGEGGAVATNNKKLYDWLLKARLHGMSKGAADRYSKLYEHYDMEILGYKANMSNIQAALLIHQVDTLDNFLEKKEKIAQRFDKGFKNNPYVTTPTVLPNSIHSRHLYSIWVNRKKRDEYMKALQQKGIGVAVNFRAIHLMSYYRKNYGYKKGDFPIAEKIGDGNITLPFYLKLTPKEIHYIIDSVNEIVTA